MKTLKFRANGKLYEFQKFFTNDEEYYFCEMNPLISELAIKEVIMSGSLEECFRELIKITNKTTWR